MRYPKLIPMLFSEEMALANHTERKTVTRRPLNPQPEVIGQDVKFTTPGAEITLKLEHLDEWSTSLAQLTTNRQKGDVLWMRETYGVNDGYIARVHRAGSTIQKWKPSIHMPLKACKYFALIQSVTLERLHDITAEEAEKEGIQYFELAQLWGTHNGRDMFDLAITPVVAFNFLWTRAYSFEHWRSNPFVIRTQYRRLTAHEVEIILPDILQGREPGKDRDQVEKSLIYALKHYPKPIAK